jgi:hypothetical protein
MKEAVSLVSLSGICPKDVELILEINKTVIVASSWCSIFTLPTLIMHGQTQIKCKFTFIDIDKIGHMRAKKYE